MTRHQHDLKSTCWDQTAPGAANHPGGVGNAQVQTEHANRERAGKEFLMSCVVKGSQLETRLAGAA